MHFNKRGTSRESIHSYELEHTVVVYCETINFSLMKVFAATETISKMICELRKLSDKPSKHINKLNQTISLKTPLPYSCLFSIFQLSNYVKALRLW